MSIAATTFKAVIISSFCKLLAIPVYIWAEDWGGLLPELLQVVTRFQVFKGNGSGLTAKPPSVCLYVAFLHELPPVLSVLMFVELRCCIVQNFYREIFDVLTVSRLGSQNLLYNFKNVLQHLQVHDE